MFSFYYLTLLQKALKAEDSMEDDHPNYDSDQYEDEENYAKTIEYEFSALIDKISSIGSISSWYDANCFLHKIFGYREGEKFNNILKFHNIDDKNKVKQVIDVSLYSTFFLIGYYFKLLIL